MPVDANRGSAEEIKAALSGKKAHVPEQSINSKQLDSSSKAGEGDKLKRIKLAKEAFGESFEERKRRIQARFLSLSIKFEIEIIDGNCDVFRF